MSYSRSVKETLGLTPDLTFRSLPILASYIILAAALALNACRTIFKRYQARQRNDNWVSSQRRLHFFLFAVLAGLSLGATWYYMFAFFAHSYRNWEQSVGKVHSPALGASLITRLESWLQDTKLFREAWETVIETPARFWWSGQIFLWTTGWSVFLGIMARRYSIPHVWAYMLLGQIVAISFAQNLFFATILVSQHARSAKARGEEQQTCHDSGLIWSPPLYLEVLPVAISLLSTVMVPSVAHTKYFMALLLIPHLLLFVPATLRPGHRTLAAKSQDSIATKMNAARRYILFFELFIAVCLALQAHSTYLVLQNLNTSSYATLAQTVLGAVYEHPAASSVSWDVIYCTVSAIAWTAVNGGSPIQMLGGA